MSSAPLLREIETDVPAQGTAGTAQDFVVGEAPFAGTVTQVTVIPEASVNSDATNFRTIRIINKGQTGAGTTVVASLPLNVAGNNLVAFDEKGVPLSGTAANLVVAEGDVLVADETVTGLGLAHGGYVVKVEVSRS